ncbi:YdcF family protein [Adhaeribacter sp. BT258]|uniref:YdcF family protein n=1 Tax=Adhaeribacter terrigena TaxID=2793070 RepID=A0ABS1BZ82_9BACT|nr:YdcF family protein [Adhaeribacter terrigena]MBK0402437.1 YdcF family protein [Adhaeribacter terrigena]
MFFYLSKLLDFLLLPIIWIFVLLLLGLILKNPLYRKRFLMAAIGLLLLLSNPFLINEAFLAWEKPPVPIKELPVYDAGIVLTGITSGDKSPHDRVYLNKGADRIMHALHLYRAGKIKKIIISGGSGAILERYATEADELHKILQMANVPENDILVEDQSRNTRENALYTKELLGKHPELKSTLLITSAFHMRRSEGCFKKAGLQPDIFPADFYSVDRSFTPDDLLLPQEYCLHYWSVLVHEMVGFFLYKVLGYI